MAPETYFGGYDLNRLWGTVINTGTYTYPPPTIYSRISSNLSGYGHVVNPHHPMHCQKWETHWKVGEDGMECEHAEVDCHDPKLQASLRISVCELIMHYAEHFKGLGQEDAPETG